MVALWRGEGLRLTGVQPSLSSPDEYIKRKLEIDGGIEWTEKVDFTEKKDIKCSVDIFLLLSPAVHQRERKGVRGGGEETPRGIGALAASY